MSERFEQSSFLTDTSEIVPVQSSEPPEHTKLREAVSAYLNLEDLRDPQIDIRRALRYDSESLPLEIKRMVGMLEILLTPEPQEPIRSPSQLARYFELKIGFRQQEELWVVSLNTKNCVQGIDRVYQGSVNAAMIRIMEIMRWPIHYNSPAMFLVHSHPSGFAEPSPEDVNLTQQVITAAKLFDCECLDHLVIGQARYTSMREKEKKYNLNW